MDILQTLKQPAIVQTLSLLEERLRNFKFRSIGDIFLHKSAIGGNILI